jgi:6-phosphogluconolactonase (cycloisomerase 2 family)
MPAQITLFREVLLALLLTLVALNGCTKKSSDGRQYAYVATAMDGTVSMHEVDHKTGALTFLGSVKTRPGASSILISPSGQHAFVTNEQSNTISPFAINTKTGILTPTSADPALTGFKPFPLVHPSGRFVYALSSGGSDLSAFETNPVLGMLGEVAGSPFHPAGMSGSYKATFDSKGRFAYTTHFTQNEVKAFAVDEASGAWTMVEGSTYRTADHPSMVAIHPSGHYVYVSTNSGVQGFGVERASGKWTPFSKLVIGAFGAGHLLIDPTGKFILIGGADGGIRVCQIDYFSGALSETSNALPNPNPVSSMALDSSGRFLYVTHMASYRIHGFQLSPSGTLIPISGSPFLTAPEAPLYTKPPIDGDFSKHNTGIALTSRYH